MADHTPGYGVRRGKAREGPVTRVRSSRAGGRRPRAARTA
jgi:hypothetical protein